MQELKNFINGEYVAPNAGKYLDNYSPVDGSKYSLIPDSDSQDIAAAVDAAKQAYELWSQESIASRMQYLNAIADLLEQRSAEFAKAECIDQGKLYSLAYEIEMKRAVKNFRFFASALQHQLESATPIDNNLLNYTQRMPIGVAGLISPWNLPLYLLTWKIAPAIAYGNTCVCKPSELTPMTAFLMGKIFQDAKLPKGVVNIVHGLGTKAGQALTEHPDVPLISFTGGTATGNRILEAAAPKCKKVGLELGGKNPALIFADCDLEATVATTVRSSFTNQGEICLCNSRVFVERSIYPEFLEKLILATKEFKVGDPFSENSQMGALVSKEHKAKVESYIAIAKEEGGKIEIGGKSPELDQRLSEGYYLEPTIITNLSVDSRCMQEEIFGPVVCIVPFDSEEQALEYANGVDYGLSASVWSQDIKKAHRVAQKIEAGTVWINTWMVRDLRVPFGGMKASGMGREGQMDSVDFFTEAKNICVQL